MTKAECNYKLPDDCCATCKHSMLNDYGEPICSKIKAVPAPFPYSSDNNIDMGAKCDMFEHSGLVLEQPRKEYVDQFADCVFKGSGACDEQCQGCEAYNNGKQGEEGGSNMGVLTSCKHYGLGGCDHRCIGCRDYDGPGSSMIMVDGPIYDEVQSDTTAEALEYVPSVDELDDVLDSAEIVAEEVYEDDDIEYTEQDISDQLDEADDDDETIGDFTADDCQHYGTGACDEKCRECEDYEY